ncbi:MAG: endonuclease domain-containing protein [Pseudonocardia sp.]
MGDAVRDRYRVDFAFPVARLVVEVDGWAWHSDAARFRSDRARQNALVLAGWAVLRFHLARPHGATGRRHRRDQASTGPGPGRLSRARP